MNAQNSSKNKWQILLLLLIFLAPMGFAWYYFQTQDTREFKTKNYGDLIRPAIGIQKLSFKDPQNLEKFTGADLKGKWWIVYVSPDKCQEHCHENLYNIKQLITALGKDAQRVSSLFLSLPDCQQQACEKYVLDHYPDMKNGELPSDIFEKVFANNSVKLERERVGEVFICDPKGFVMLRYSGETDHQYILKDLKRLLKISKVG